MRGWGSNWGRKAVWGALANRPLTGYESLTRRVCCRARGHGCVQTAGTWHQTRGCILRQIASTPGGQRPLCLAGACGAWRLLWSDKIAKQGIKHRLACLDRRTSQYTVTVDLSRPPYRSVSPGHPLCASCVVLKTRLHCLPPCPALSSALLCHCTWHQHSPGSLSV